jgi:hypothetical protein
MTPAEIIQYDTVKNGTGDVTAQQVMGQLNAAVKQGWKVMQQGDTLIIFKKTKGTEAEFHTFNAARSAQLVENVIKLFALLKKVGFTTAFTTYSNPKISSLFESAKDRVNTTITNEGGSFKAQVEL